MMRHVRGTEVRDIPGWMDCKRASNMAGTDNMIRRVGSGKASLGVWRFSQCEAHTDQRRLCRNSILNCLGMLRRHVIVIGQHRRLVVGLGGLLAFTLCLWSALLRLVLGPCLILIVPALLFVLFGELRCLLIVSVLTIDLVWPGPRGAHNLASRRTFHADHCPSPPPDLLGSCLMSAEIGSSIVSTLRTFF